MSTAQAELFKKFSAKSEFAQRKNRRGRCATRYCRGRLSSRVYQRKRIKGSAVVQNKFCSKCMMRQWKQRNPNKYFYSKLKHNARRRQKEFELTLEEFSRFVLEQAFPLGDGKAATSMTLDRKDSTKGYTLDNLQLLTNRENGRKGQQESVNPF